MTTFFQDLFTYAKLFALFVIIVTGVVQLCRGKVNTESHQGWKVETQLAQNENFTFEETEPDVTKVALSFYSGGMFQIEIRQYISQSGLFAYNGWNYLNFVIEEMKDPVRDLPKAIIISVALVTIFYVLANVAFYTTLNVPEVLGSEAVAVVSCFFLWSYFVNQLFECCILSPSLSLARLLREGCTGRLPFSSRSL